MPKRFIFRQVCSRDLGVFLEDGEIRSKNHPRRQNCHQTSHPGIVERRGHRIFDLPHGGVVNDYVPFYFSPLSSFTYAISRESVELRSPTGESLGKAKDDERIFIVCDPLAIAGSGAQISFSNIALNSLAPPPQITSDINQMETLIDWTVFDEAPLSAQISEIGYNGVCAYFKNQDTPPARQNRSQKRMAEFLVKDSLPLQLVTCIIAKSDALRQNLEQVMAASNWAIPIHAKRNCFF